MIRSTVLAVALCTLVGANALAQADCDKAGEDAATLQVVDEACKVVHCEEGKIVTVDSKETLQKLVKAYEGQPLVFFLFGTWCPHCKHELKDELPALYKTYSAKGVRFVGVAVNQRSESDLKDFVQELHIDFTVWRDPGMTTARAIGAFGVPHTVFIDAQGKVAYERIGPYAKDDAAVVKALDHIAASQVGLH